MSSPPRPSPWLRRLRRRLLRLPLQQHHLRTISTGLRLLPRRVSSLKSSNRTKFSCCMSVNSHGDFAHTLNSEPGISQPIGMQAVLHTSRKTTARCDAHGKAGRSGQSEWSVHRHPCPPTACDPNGPIFQIASASNLQLLQMPYGPLLNHTCRVFRRSRHTYPLLRSRIRSTRISGYTDTAKVRTLLLDVSITQLGCI